MNKQKIYWTGQIVGWSFYGLFNMAIYFLFNENIKGVEIFGTVFQIGYYIISTHFLRWLIKIKGWKTYSSLRMIPIMLVTNLVLGLSNYLMLLSFSFLTGTLSLSIELKAINVVLGILGPSSLYTFWSLIYFTFHYFEQYNKSLKYEAVIRNTELNHLRSQLNPHFIFNALNSIRALVDENPKKSKKAISQLSGIFRNSLQSDKRKLVTLEEEIQIVSDYLGLESIRFEERLSVKINMSPHTRYFKIPPMMIQTLAENGIKHGISQTKEGGFIDIKIYLESDFLFIQIRNSGVYLDSKKSGDTHGLSNTRKRLELIYGESAKFNIENEKENVVLMEIILPREPNYESNNN
ncbi:MAG: histidine kinase [Reichenbachiella sp.]